MDGEIEPRYRFQNTASIVFCPLFFDDEKFPNIQVVKDNVDEPYLSNVECSERIMLHEYMHLPWIRDMPGGKNDKIGFFDAADLASKWPWGTIRANPDN